MVTYGTDISAVMKGKTNERKIYCETSTVDDSGHIRSTPPPSDSTLPVVKILKNDVFYASSLRGLIDPMVELFRLCILTYIFFSCCKHAYIQSVPEKGDCSNPSNYRPIGLLSSLSYMKVL